MTGPSEASDADLVEQATPVDEQPEASTTDGDVPLEVDTADAAEQAVIVPELDDERR